MPFSTLEEAREAAKAIIRSPGTEVVEILVPEVRQDSKGDAYLEWVNIERWTPRIPGIDDCDRLYEVGGKVVRGKYIIGGDFTCFTSPEEAIRIRGEPDPDAAE